MLLSGLVVDPLKAVIEVPGAVVSKDELLRRIWPGRIVEENRGCRMRFGRYVKLSGRTAS
jgi:hypothetical protein